ncbi:MAG: hypothetical protein ACHQF2_01020 [Flavobacteriales bacterium]
MKLAGRISSVFLIAFLVMQLTVPFFVVQSKRNAFYKEAKKKMKREMGVKIAVNDLFSDPGFRWEKKGKEFFYKGGMYDVGRLVKENNKYVMYAVPDFMEKAYLENLAKNDPTSDDGVFSFAPINLFPPSEIISLDFMSITHKDYFVYGLQCLTADQLPEDSPPKKLV